MSKARILLVGDYPVLLDTRALLLREWDSQCSCSKDALETIHSCSFDAVVIGQSVPAGMALEIAKTAKSTESAPEIIAIRFPEDEVDLGVETHTTDLGENPGWLSERVAFLLARRSAAIL